MAINWEDMLNEVNQEIDDMNTAMAEAEARGETLADYDLATRRAQVTEKRKAAELAEAEGGGETMQTQMQTFGTPEESITAAQQQENAAPMREPISPAQEPSPLEKMRTPNRPATPQTPMDKPAVGTPGFTPAPTATGRVVSGTATTRQRPQEQTYTRFNVAGSDYDVIRDTEQARQMIQFDDQGNVAPDSPVQVVGKDVSGGFILAGQKGTRGLDKMKIAISDGQINFPQAEIEPGRLQRMHFGTINDAAEAFDPQAATELYGIYQRTGER